MKLLKRTTKRETIKKLYLDYVNNFLTVQAFADYYHFSDEKADRIIDIGRALHYRKRYRSFKK